MIFQHGIHLNQIHSLFPIFQVLKTPNCLNLEPRGWVFLVQELEQALELLENELYGNCVSVFLLFVDEERVFFNFVDVESFFHLWNCAEIRGDALSKCLAFGGFLSDAERNESGEAWSDGFVDFTLVVQDFVFIDMAFNSELNTTNVYLLTEFGLSAELFLGQTHLPFFLFFQFSVPFFFDLENVVIHAVLFLLVKY